MERPIRPSMPGAPFSAQKAVQIALSQVGHSTYKLGTGDCDDDPDDFSDCAGFAINRCYGLRRHRPGFNTGSWATVSDDLNCNSAIEDAEHKRELFTLVHDVPRPGDLLTYPTFTSRGKRFIGHIGIVTHVPAEWDWDHYEWEDLTVAQCCGPNGRKPGIIQSSGATWDRHDKLWPKPEHRTRLIRVKHA